MLGSSSQGGPSHSAVLLAMILVPFKKKMKKIRLLRWDLAPKEVPLIRQY